MIRTSPLAFVLCAVTLALTGCEQGAGTEATNTGQSCAESDLIAQCPPGSSPELSAEATSQCEASGSIADAPATGKVEGVCGGTGECQVYCNFAIPCDCGVERITDEGVFCKDCLDTAACGNGVCEGTESPESCPMDCDCICETGASRCNGPALQVCERCEWTELGCAANESCRRLPEGGAECQRTGI